MSRAKGPQFVGWFGPLLDTLRELGDSGRPREVSARIAERLSVPDRVLFQCKRYTKQVSPAHIREFRGAMANRVNRGIFLATSTFSAEAKREATREGAAPIELVDLDGLIKLLSDLGLGVTTRTILIVDTDFFRDFMPPAP